MAKNKKHSQSYDEFEGVRKRRVEPPKSRHNFKDHLKDVLENENWDELEDECYYESHQR
jgi:hypothetical protein